MGWSGNQPTGVADLGRFHQGLVFRQKGLNLREPGLGAGLQLGAPQQRHLHLAMAGILGQELDQGQAAIGPEEQVGPGSEAEGEELAAGGVGGGQQGGVAVEAIAVVAHRALFPVQGGGVGDGDVVVVEGVVVGNFPVAGQRLGRAGQQHPGLVEQGPGLLPHQIELVGQGDGVRG